MVVDGDGCIHELAFRNWIVWILKMGMDHGIIEVHGTEQWNIGMD